MKRLFLGGLLLFAAIGSLKAQDCEALVLPYFNNNAQQMADYPQPKLFYRCTYAQEAFYESDTIPLGAIMYSVTEIKDRFTGTALTLDFVFDKATFSVYQYNFIELQNLYASEHTVLCFATPASQHPYLVFRSPSDLLARTSQIYEDYVKGMR